MARIPRRGDVVLIGFPFTDLSATKVRPAVVVSPDAAQRDSGDVLLAAISSVVPARPRPSDAILAVDDAEFGSSGLKKSSVILTSKLVAMEQRLVLRWLGRLGPRTTRRLDAALGT